MPQGVCTTGIKPSLQTPEGRHAASNQREPDEAQKKAASLDRMLPAAR